jgi:RHS repeat-associated protein
VSPNTYLSGSSSIGIAEGNLRDAYKVVSIKSEFGATIDFSLHYNSYNADDSRAAIDTVMGYGWTHSYNIFLFSQNGHMFRMDGTGRVTKYQRNLDGTFTTAPGYFETFVQTSSTTFTISTKNKTRFSFALIPDTPFSINGPVYRLTSVADRNNNITSLSYTNGNLTSITDTYGRSLTLVYNNQHKLISITDPLLRSTTLEYDTTGTRLLKITDPENKFMQYSYNSLNQLIGKVDKDSNAFSYLYENQKPVAIVDGAGAYLFSLTNSQNWATDPNALALNQVRAYVPAVTAQTDGRGNFWYHEYDSNGYVIRIVAREKFPHIERDTREKPPSAPWSRGSTTATYTYDPATLKVTTVIDEEGHTTSYQYDATGNRLTMTNALGHVTTYAYEQVFNQMTSMTDPNGRVTTYQYDLRGNRIREIDPLGNSQEWTYDSHGNVLTSKDENGNLAQYIYDSHGNYTSITEAIGTSIQRITTMTHNVVGNRLSHTNANANTTTYAYDLVDRLTHETDPLGRVTETSYDGMGNRTRVTNRDGNSTLYQYDLRRRLVTTTDALGHTTTATYDGNNNRISMTDKNGYITKYEYDLHNRLSLITDALNKNTTRTYDGVGNLLDETDANNHITRYEYDALNRVTRKIDAVGAETLYGYDMVGLPGCTACTGPTLGSDQITKQTDCNGKVIYNKYDGLDRPILEIHKEGDTVDVIDPSDAVARYAYDANGNRLSVTEPNGNITTFEYDSLDRLKKKTNAAGDMTILTYDGLDNVITQTDPNQNITTNTYDSLDRLIRVDDRIARVASYSYKGEGNPVRESDGNGNTTRYEYDKLYRVTKIIDAAGETTHYQYDPMGNLIKVTDRAGRITTFAYDALHRRTSMINALGQTTRYEYDGVGNLVKITDAKSTPAITQYDYDGLNRVIKETNPDAPPNTRTFSYDCAGNLSTLTDQKGQTTAINYNDLYFPIKRDNPVSADDNITFDLSGRMLSAERGGWLVTFSYDGGDRLTQSAQNGKTVNYVYDIPGRKRTLTYPGGRSITEQMDFRDRATEINQTGSPPIVQYNYDTGNRVVSRAYSNGSTANFTYNVNDWVISLEHSRGPSRIAGFGHDYDKEGNLLIEEKRHDTARSEAYQYDLTHRLINYKVGQVVGPTIPVPVTQSFYELDGANNWINKITNDVSEPRQHNAVNEITSIAGVPLINDDNGNLIEDQVYRYAYDEDNRLTSVTRKLDNQVVGQYQYDALGRRVAKIANPAGIPTETRYFYDVDQIIEEQSASGVSRATYVYGNYVDEAITMDRNGQTYYYHQNSLLSVAAMTDSTGSVVERYRYDAYGGVSITDGAGNPLGGISAIGNPLMFTGMRLDEESGLYNYRTRYLDSLKGRFTSRDSIGSWGDGESLGNAYAYVGNNPASFVDGDGTKRTRAERKQARQERREKRKERRDERRAAGKAWWQIAGKGLLIVAKFPFVVIRFASVLTKGLFTWTNPFKILSGKPYYGNWCGSGNKKGPNGEDLPPIDELDKCCAAHDLCAKTSSVYASFTEVERDCNQEIAICARRVECKDKYPDYWSKKARECRAARADIRRVFGARVY